MSETERITHITRRTIDELASEEGAPVMTPGLLQGEEYLDLSRLEDGVRRADHDSTLQPDMLPRKAVCEETWAKILVHLPISPFQPPSR